MQTAYEKLFCADSKRQYAYQWHAIYVQLWVYVWSSSKTKYYIVNPDIVSRFTARNLQEKKNNNLYVYVALKDLLVLKYLVVYFIPELTKRI